MLMVYGNASSDSKEKLIEIGHALEREGFVIAYNGNYFSLVIMTDDNIEKDKEVNN